MKRLGVLLSTVAVIAASLPAVAPAQEVIVDRSRGVTLLGYLTHYFNEGDDLGGGGVRLLFNFGALTNTPSPLLNRSALGGFVSFTQADVGGVDVDGLQIGSQFDLRFFETPVSEILDPFASIAAGIMRFSNGDSSTELLVSPGTGAYFHLLRGSVVVFRGDLRYNLVTGDFVDSFFEAAAGVGIRF